MMASTRLAPSKHFIISSLAYPIQRSLLILIENTLKEENVAKIICSKRNLATFTTFSSRSNFLTYRYI